NRDGDRCRFRVLKGGTRAETIAAIALPNHRLSRHHESGPVGELHEKLSGSLLSDDLAARAIITNDRCSLHMSPRLWRMTRQHRSSVGRAAVPGLSGCDRASARHTVGARQVPLAASLKSDDLTEKPRDVQRTPRFSVTMPIARCHSWPSADPMTR